jgi:hypothetical protein
MPAQMRADLLPLLHGNLEHIESVRSQIRSRERLLDIEHREWTICLGRGFDFLHTPNVALIIGPYSPNLDVPIRKAAGNHRSQHAAPDASRTMVFCSWRRCRTRKSASTARAPSSSRASCRTSPPTSLAP